MESLKETLNYFVAQVTKSVGVCTALIGIFLYHVILDKDLECTCEIKAFLCWLYMILPALVILLMVLWFDRSFQVLLKYTCLKGTRKFCCFLWPCIFRAFFVGMLWPISVLIDGDCYACCWNEKKLFCRNQTAEVQMSIKELKNTSGIIGFGALLCIVFVAGCLWLIPWRKCCCCCCESESRNEDVLFQKIVLEEGENLVTNKLIEAAKVKINEKLNGYANSRQWERCCDVVLEIILGPLPHEAPNPSAEEGGNGSGEETEPTGQSQSHGSPSVSTPNADESTGQSQSHRSPSVSTPNADESTGQTQSHRSPSVSTPNADESTGQSQSHGSPSVSTPNADEPTGQTQSHRSSSESSHNYGENEPLLRESQSDSHSNVATS